MIGGFGKKVEIEKSMLGEKNVPLCVWIFKRLFLSVVCNKL